MYLGTWTWAQCFLCQLFVLLSPSRELRLHPKQENFVKQLRSYEIITPTRLNDFGETFPHSQHFRRKRSSALEPWAVRAHYQISAFGHFFYLNLSADSGFIAPWYRVSHLGSGEPGEPHSDLKHCFYVGHVNSRIEHTAVVSLCTGLMGTFQTGDGQYFLEPLMKADGGQYEDEHNKPHLIYQHEPVNHNSSWKVSHPCAAFDQTRGRKKKHLKMYNADSIREHLGILQRAMKTKTLTGMGTNLGNKTHQHSRQKRFLSYPRFVEVMVTADNKMAHHHGRNLQHYVLTLMSIVATIYRDSSIGNLINIVIVKLIVINNEQEGPSISFNAATTLHNFCVWQQSQNNVDDTHPFHHDTAVLITREDICRARNKCDTLGLAELGTMCDPYRSCSISEENGLSTAFTIVHELGHVFNMPHDDSLKCREARVKHQYHVMAATLNYHTSPWTWSKCSRKYITQFLDTGYGECLLDEPTVRNYDLPTQLPGQIYNANMQCELMFGAGSQVCPYMKQCKRLWCTSAEGVHRGCRTQHMPLADGTDCGQKMHCQRGVCVSRGSSGRTVDGEWGPWGQYGACSRPCGGGIRSAVRDCNQPGPRNGGKYCIGRRMKFQSCNTEPCAKGSKDFREQQCSEFNGKHFNINGLPQNVHWLPKYSGVLMKDRCKLLCRVAGTTAYYQLKDWVTDGTPCGPDTYDICVQGLCRQAGCDHVLHSKSQRDKCGVCGGDNSSCRMLAGTFNNVQYGYNVVVRIPSGATNIEVQQHSYSGKPEDDNYLALSDSHGKFILNGNFVVSMFQREIIVQGTTIEYSGSDSDVERINCTGRIEEGLTLQVLSVGNLNNPDVHYSFNVPVQDQLELFAWDQSGPWQVCNKPCQGERRRKVVCVRQDDHLVVSDQRCEHMPRPTAGSERCSTDCEIRWHAAGKSECTAWCGPGHRMRDILCVRSTHGKGTREPMDDRYCAHQPKPPSREPCHGDCLRTSWQYTSWSQCSKSCGSGNRTREAYCMNNLGRRLANQECNSQQTIVSEKCNEFPCPEWSASHWSKCTASCGRGYRLRAVRCVVAMDSAVRDDRECDAATRPRDSEACEMPPCLEPPKVIPSPSSAARREAMTQWRFGSWTPCSGSCGPGTSTRYVACLTHHHQLAADSDCNASDRLAKEQECSVTPCPHVPLLHHHPAHLPQVHVDSPSQDVVSRSSWDNSSAESEWRTGPWGGCTQPCDSGTRTRLVICQLPQGHRVSEQNCNILEKPPDREDCNMQPCPDSISWHRGAWNSCSASCGRGIKHREVVCVDAGQSIVDRKQCEHLKKPRVHKKCRSGRCPAWRSTPWMECSVTCGTGFQQRDVFCRLRGTGRVFERMCSPFSRPAHTQLCHMPICLHYEWLADEWQDCSAPCGAGVQIRSVQCVSHAQEQMDHRYCNLSSKPLTMQSCFGAPCQYIWTAGVWSQCSVSCGPGYQQRVLSCREVHSGQDLNSYPPSASSSGSCPQPAPVSVQQCHIRKCPPSARWRVGAWSKCSVPCGVGLMERAVQCLTENSLPSELCRRSQKPHRHTPCFIRACDVSASCRDIQKTKEIQKDGEYLLKIEGKLRKIYCAGMDSDHPREYVTLSSGEAENYSEVYGYRLRNPYECPYEGKRRKDCSCHRDYRAAGYTVFHKVRFDISSMQIIITDLEFAWTVHGRPVPFATAGDCYSAAKCPQGRFSMNLSWTGLKVAEASKWVAQGNYATVNVHRSQDGTRVAGKCGGYCGKCTPQGSPGLLLQVQ
ncbi:A disintegrin and metalloproteinase with thrombospondin motifs 20-like isoform X2 [Narcine bancroftii]|uniref:A disintegrin and metalloproteinase with thrombospondin motifs 20-like isoform X2 n=1 Tax=Narcine bancroftii TaxID=1343680 RepID=UPI0038320729